MLRHVLHKLALLSTQQYIPVAVNQLYFCKNKWRVKRTQKKEEYLLKGMTIHTVFWQRYGIYII